MKYIKKPRKRYKIVIDANVIVSSIFGGYLARVIEIAKSHTLFAPARLESFLGKVKRRGDFSDLINYFNYILRRIKLITVKDTDRISSNRVDEFYIAVALQKSIDFLITGDKDILSCREMRDLPSKILTPKEFVEMLESEI
ncbi:hypothetical protein H5T89_04570 [bacterium]|nr:hypothetical protein [bacterium]